MQNHSFKKIPFFFLLFFSIGLSAQSTEMTNLKMHQIFKDVASEVEGQLGAWTMVYGERLLMVLTDETNNRMRIFTPVLEQSKLERGQLEKMLEANFHSALDAKYSLYEGFVISVFTHPLEELQKDENL